MHFRAPQHSASDSHKAAMSHVAETTRPLIIISIFWPDYSRIMCNSGKANYAHIISSGLLEAWHGCNNHLQETGLTDIGKTTAGLQQNHCMDQMPAELFIRSSVILMCLRGA